MNDTGTLLPLTATARLLHVPAAWLRAEADAGRVSCLRAGKTYLFDVDLVERQLLDRARQPREEKGVANAS
jgi:hypothetical protein